MAHLYLVDRNGSVYKQATLSEAKGLPIITGITRREYLSDPAQSTKKIKLALEQIARYRRKSRPRLGEVHIDHAGRFSFFLAKGAAMVRIGHSLDQDKLRRFDKAWSTLGPDVAKVLAIYLDHTSDKRRAVVRMVTH